MPGVPRVAGEVFVGMEPMAWWRNRGDCALRYSRYLSELRALESARSETVQKSFERPFERYGLPEAIRSDNGSPFASRSAVLGVRCSDCATALITDY
jgi:hypothetical protein